MTESQLKSMFPREVDVIRQQTAEFQRKSSSERFDSISELIAAGLAMLEASPNPEAARRMREADREEWRQAHRKLMARHAT